MASSTPYITVINRLRDILRQRGLSLTQFAALLEVDLSEVSRWLNHRVEMKLSSLFRICEVLNIDPVELFKTPGTKAKTQPGKRKGKAPVC